MAIIDKIIKDFFENNNNLKSYLLLLNIFLILLSITGFNLGVLPFKHIGDFIFLIFIVFLFALYRPGWAFLFFVGTIILENINLAPENIELMLRPYQILGALGMLAIIIRFFSKRLNFNIPKFFWYDWMLVLFSVSGFVSALLANNKEIALKQSLVIFSFLVLYFFSRIFIQSLKDIKRILPFFLGSSFIVIIYSIWQNWRFLHYKNHFEAMAGRPNGTFVEADWLGMFLVFLLAIIYSLIYQINYKLKNTQKFSILPISRQVFKQFINSNNQNINWKLGFKIFSYFLLLTTCYALLILTVSRSAWLGAGVVSVIFILYILKNKNYNLLGLIFNSILLSFGIIYIFGLTNFELGNRIQSTGSGKQEITISCGKSNDVPRLIRNVSELEKYNCRHINLENIEKEKLAGHAVIKVYRDDPSVSIRGEIYKKSWEEIKKNPIFGIGWGNISEILGVDKRGAGLNSSNIFLEIWLGAGIVGLIVFVLVLGNIFYKGILLFGNNFKFKISNLKSNTNDQIFNGKEETQVWKLFLILSFFAILIPNLFNAGIMLGFLWMWLAIVQIKN